MGTIVRELAFYYVVCWVLIYGIAIKRIYSYSKVNLGHVHTSHLWTTVSCLFIYLFI